MRRLRRLLAPLSLMWVIGCSDDLTTAPMKVPGEISRASVTTSCDDLQASLNQAGPGDDITISEGSPPCTGHYELPSFQITLQGTPPSGAILDGAGEYQILSGDDVGNTVIRYLTFRNGVSSEGGGAIRLEGNSAPTIENSTFLGNSADGNGGAISLDGSSTATIENSTFLGNSAGSSGGAVFIRAFSVEGGDPSSEIFLRGNVFGSATEPNTASRDGGALALTTDARVTLTGNRFSNNSGVSGGGFYVRADGGVVSGNTVTDNSATAGGGAVLFGYGVDGQFTFDGNVIKNNSAVDVTECPSEVCALGEGGGLYLSRAAARGGNNTVSDNSATLGGGFFISEAELSLSGSTVSANTAASKGGGIYAGGPVSLTNSTISSNVAGQGGGLYSGFATVSLLNATFADNRAATGTGGGLHTEVQPEAGSAVTTKNTIFARNLGSASVPGNCGGVSPVSGGHNLEDADTCGFNTTPADGDLVGVNSFIGPLADNGGPTFTHALVAGSPAIDAGDNIGCPTVDQRGQTRPKDGNGDGVAACDIGAYERDGPNTAPSIVAPPSFDVSTDAGVCVAAAVSIGTPTVTDDADGVTVNGVRNDGAALNAAYPKGATTITWTATDAGGLTSSADQSITVNDNEAPSIVAQADRVVNTEPGALTATVNVVSATAADNCPNVTVEGLSGNQSFPIGTTTITWTATDEIGNSNAASQNITVHDVHDVESPTISVPASFTVNATRPTGAFVTYATPASDNSGSVTVACDHPSGSVFAIGITATTCTATDPSGNTASGSFRVTVLGAPQQIANLLEYIKGMAIPGAHRTQLINALQTVLSNPRSTRFACPAFNLFIKVVRAKTPTYIPADKSAQIITDATRIKAVIGCPIT